MTTVAVWRAVPGAGVGFHQRDRSSQRSQKRFGANLLRKVCGPGAGWKPG